MHGVSDWIGAENKFLGHQTMSKNGIDLNKKGGRSLLVSYNP